MTNNHCVLVTGAQGLVGAHIMAKAKTALGFVGSARKTGTKYFLDLSQTDSIAPFLNELRPRCIINCGGITAIDKAAQNQSLTQIVNVDSVKKIAQWCALNKARLIQFSTDFVYDGGLEYYTERSKTMPTSVYGQSKLDAEEAALNNNPNTAVVRTSLVYGYLKNLSRPNFPLFLKTKLERGVGIKITADQYRSPTYAGDLAQATIDLTHTDYTGIIHIAGPERVSVYEFAKIIAREFSLDFRLMQPVNTGLQQLSASRPLSTGLSIDRARELLHYNPISISEGVREMHRALMEI